MVDKASDSLRLLCRCGATILLPSSHDVVSHHLSLSCEHCGRTYAWSHGVLVLGEEASQEDYPDEVYALLADIEPRHFWFSGRNKLIISAMRKTLGPLAGRSVLDVGCGTGFVLAALEQAGMHVCGLDMHMAGLRFARQRTRGLLVCETATRIPFSEQFDAVMLCDVIEHTPDDSQVIYEASQALKQSGAVIITVPADPHLWTALDDVSGHKRRYTRQTLTQAIEGAGLRVRTLRYFNILLFPVQALQRRIFKSLVVTDPSNHIQLFRDAFRVPPSPLNTLFGAAMAADIPLSSIPVPFGASLIAIAERR